MKNQWTRFLRIALIGWLLGFPAACGDSDSTPPADGDSDTEAAASDESDRDLSDGDAEVDAEFSEDGDADPDPDRTEGETDADGGFWPQFGPDHPLLSGSFRNIAHRGGGRLAPEETLPAYERALAEGADMLEMDLHATSDNVVVLHHDATVDRTTDGEGLIREMPFETLRTLDAGYRFTADGGETYPFRGTGVRVPTFEEVLEAFPDQVFTVEIKQIEPSIVDLVLDVLDRTHMNRRVILVSFSDSVVQDIREKRPDQITGAATGEMILFAALKPENLDDYRPPCPFFQMPSSDAEQVALAHDLGIRVQIWTVNGEAEMREWLAMGVDGIMTDDPSLLERVLTEAASP